MGKEAGPRRSGAGRDGLSEGKRKAHKVWLGSYIRISVWRGNVREIFDVSAVVVRIVLVKHALGIEVIVNIAWVFPELKLSI
jgi:hypothetical protein